MKAIVRHNYGSPDVLNLETVQKPTPKDNELLIKLHATSINAMDYRFMKADPFFIRFVGLGVLKPKKFNILGFNIAGRVEAVGKDVTEFKVGDEVFGSCNGGGFAEYVCAVEKWLLLKPENASFKQAAALPTAAITALQGLRDAGKIQAGQKVMIHGASGGVGTFAVQLAKHFGAEVTAVCSTRNVDIAFANGADHVIDYTKEDFLQSGQQYDLIFAVNGNRSIYDYKQVLKPQGIYVLAGGSGNKQMFQALILGKRLSKEGGQTFREMDTAKMVQEDLRIVRDLLADGHLRPVIDKTYPLAATRTAFQYLEDVHAQGKVVVTM